MNGRNGRKEIDMVSGPLLWPMICFTIPVILSGILQLLFNAVDIIVVGRYAGEEALAAVGSTTALINLLTNLFIGLSIGSNVLAAHYLGAKRDKDTEKVVHTSLMTSVICGIVLAFIGFFAVEPILVLMGSPAEILPLSALYLKIYFLGMPVVLLYNYGSALLRAVGDTRNPLLYLIIAGIVNLILNLIFVIVFGMSVAGVALATIISQAISAVLVLVCLSKKSGSIRFVFSKLGIDRAMLIKILRIGLPAGIQGTVFSFSNVLIQSSINLFGPVAMAGSAAAASLEGFVFLSMNAFGQTALNFVGQNAGAKQFDRIKTIVFLSVTMVASWGLFAGLTTCLFGRQLLGIYTSEEAVIAEGLKRLYLICGPYFLCGMMDTLVGALRGLGAAMIPTIVSLIGACGLRIVWILTFFQWNKCLENLYISYPITWTLTGAVQAVCLILLYKRYKGETGEI